MIVIVIVVMVSFSELRYDCSSNCHVQRLICSNCPTPCEVWNATIMVTYLVTINHRRFAKTINCRLQLLLFSSGVSWYSADRYSLVGRTIYG